MTGSFRPAVSHLRTLPGCGRKPDQTAIAAFILPANGPNIPGPSLVTESNAPPAGISGQPSARETISASTPAIHETGRYRPDRKTANSLRQVPASPHTATPLTGEKRIHPCRIPSRLPPPAGKPFVTAPPSLANFPHTETGKDRHPQDRTPPARTAAKPSPPVQDHSHRPACLS